MGCNCKNEGQYNVDSDVNLSKKVGNYSLRFVIFLFSLVLLPIILCASVWFMFRTLVLNKEVNLIETIKFIVKNFKNKDDDDDFDIVDEDDIDYELMDVEDITNKKQVSK